MRTENIESAKILLDQHSKISVFLNSVVESKEQNSIEVNSIELPAMIIRDDVTTSLIISIYREIERVCKDSLREIEIELSVL